MLLAQVPFVRYVDFIAVVLSLCPSEDDAGYVQYCNINGKEGEPFVLPARIFGRGAVNGQTFGGFKS
jgi:hypothetical protein